jgi:hypothetical protein
MNRKLFATVFDVALITLVIWMAFSFQNFAGGFGWFLLLGLSPRAWRR